MASGGTIVTDQNDNRPGGTGPATYNEADGIDWDIVKAQARYEDLTDRDLYARSRAALEARGEYDPARHGASWEQIAAARGTSSEQARQEYRDWAEGQHGLWTGKWGGEPGRSGLDDAGYAAAIARAAEGQLEPDPAEAYGFGRNQPGPCDREAGR